MSALAPTTTAGEPAAPSKPAVILIHGTWSSPVIWEGSKKLEARLREAFPGLIVEKLKWSGGNSGMARLQGTQKFEEEARKYKEVVVVAHSHGTNAMLGASDDVLKKVKLAIALNSPILSHQALRSSFLMRIIRSCITIFILMFLAAAVVGVCLGTAKMFGGGTVLSVLAVGSIIGYWIYRMAQTLAALLIVPAAFTVVFIQTCCLFLLPWLHVISPTGNFFQRFMEEPRPLVLVTLQLIFMLPFCVVASFFSGRLLRKRRKAAGAKGNAPQIRHLLKLNDEIMVTLGVAMALQRAVEFPLILLEQFEESFAKWICLPFVIIGAMTGILKYVVGWNTPDMWLEKCVGIVAIPFLLPFVIVTVCLIIKLLAFGCAFGWDEAGLTFGQSIYVSPGLPDRYVDLMVLPRSEDAEIAHMKIHSDPGVIDEIIKLLRYSLADLKS